MKQYLELMQEVLDTGEPRPDRTGVGTISIFGPQLRFDLTKGFPAITTKKLAWKSVVSELLWFLEGSSDERRLAEILYGDRNSPKETIWTENSTADYWKDKAQFEGDLGRVYGVQWREWKNSRGQLIDQLSELIHGIKTNPYSRRHIISAWNPGDFDLMALPPCHIMAQFYVSNSGKLSCKMYQRSADIFLGVPFNIASYSLLLHMIAQVCDLEVGSFIHTMGDAHIYLNHIEQSKLQLSRTTFPLASLKLNPEIKDITKFTMNDIELINYKSHATIKGDMAV